MEDGAFRDLVAITGGLTVIFGFLVVVLRKMRSAGHWMQKQFEEAVGKTVQPSLDRIEEDHGDRLAAVEVSQLTIMDKLDTIIEQGDKQ